MYRKANFPKYHSVVTINVKTQNVSREMKSVMTKQGVFYPLVDYFIENQFKSLSWQNNLVYAVGLFIDYIIVNKNEYVIDNNRKVYFFPDFIKLLHYGSISNEGTCKLGLYWFPKKIYRVNTLVNVLYRFLDWYYKRSKSTSDSILYTNYNELSLTEKIVYWRYWSNKKYVSLLSHIKTNNPNDNYSFINVKSNLFKTDSYDIKSFDNTKIIDLLFSGFKRANSRFDIRNILITMLMQFGGCRLSECFHIFTTDVIEDPNKRGHALVKLYHPEDGHIKYYDKISGNIISSTRKEFLKKQYNLIPRNLVSGTYKAGWKDLALEKTGKDNFAYVYWFPKWTGKLFWELYKVYIMTVVPKKMTHPYLFVSLNHKNFAQPYTINSFRDSHKKAVKKIGLKYNKDHGTTPHAHRHAYGQNLEDSKVNPKIIQKALHHRSPFSQLIYTMPSFEKINDELTEAEQKMNKQILNDDFSKSDNMLVDNLLAHLERR